MIEILGLGFRYPTNQKALENISFSVAKGATIGLVGANGSGKSTLLSLLAGLHSPTQGTVSLHGAVAPGAESSIRRMVRFVQQDADLQILGATVEEDMLLGRKKNAATLLRGQKLAQRFRLLEAWESPVHTLSWGMKRKLCLAAALLDEPEVLLLDEPFSGLDYPGIREMRAVLSENQQAGLTQIVSSHDLECFVDLLDELVVLEAGRLVVSGPPNRVLDKVAQHDVRPPCSWNAGLGIQPWEGI